MEDKNKKSKQLLDLIDKLSEGKLLHKINSWDSLDESERIILNKVREIQKTERKKRRIYLVVASGFSIVLLGFSLYMYLFYSDSSVSYSILPGNIREIKLRYGNAWVNGNTKVDIRDDSVINLENGEIFIKKEDAGK